MRDLRACVHESVCACARVCVGICVHASLRVHASFCGGRQSGYKHTCVLTELQVANAEEKQKHFEMAE